MAFMPARSWDYWWHLAFGRLTDATGEMALVNHFLYTMPADAPSYVQAWFSQWALFRIHEATSIHGVLLLRNFIAVACFLILTIWSARRSRSMMAGSIAALAVIPFGFFIISARSHLLAWPLFFVVLPICYAASEGTIKKRWLALLIPITALWVNLHGTFLVPILICIAFFGAEVATWLLRRDTFESSRLLAFLATGSGAFVATFANPRGYEVYLYFADLPSNTENLTTVTEWFPTTLTFPEFYGPWFWALFVLGLAVMFRERKQLRFADLFLMVGFSIVAIKHCRALMWFFLVYPIALSPYISRYFPSDDSEVTSSQSRLNVGIAIVIVGVLLAIQPMTHAHRVWLAGLQIVPNRTSEPMLSAVPSETPVEAVRLIGEINRDARIYHDYRYAGFLLYTLQDRTPAQTVYVDNRIELPSNEIWRAMDAMDQGTQLKRLQSYGVQFVVASRKNQSKLIDALSTNVGWKSIHDDEFNVTFQNVLLPASK